MFLVESEKNTITQHGTGVFAGRVKPEIFSFRIGILNKDDLVEGCN